MTGALPFKCSVRLLLMMTHQWGQYEKSVLCGPIDSLNQDLYHRTMLQTLMMWRRFTLDFFPFERRTYSWRELIWVSLKGRLWADYFIWIKSYYIFHLRSKWMGVSRNTQFVVFFLSSFTVFKNKRSKRDEIGVRVWKGFVGVGIWSRDGSAKGHTDHGWWHSCFFRKLKLTSLVRKDSECYRNYFWTTTKQNTCQIQHTDYLHYLKTSRSITCQQAWVSIGQWYWNKIYSTQREFNPRETRFITLHILFPVYVSHITLFIVLITASQPRGRDYQGIKMNVGCHVKINYIEKEKNQTFCDKNYVFVQKSLK